MTLWEVLAKFKSEIPKDFRPWRVDICGSNYSPYRYLSINTTYYSPSDLGWMDEPMSIYRKYGIYSSKANAIIAAKKWVKDNPRYEIECEGKCI